MGYYLGVDVGTSYTAAAVWRDGAVEVVALGDRAPAVPSVVLLRENGDVLAGEAAEIAGAVEPLRVARDFRRRLGDPTPIALDAEAHPADELTVHLVRHVLDTVRERQGGPPDGVAASHPLNWSAGRRDLLRRAFERAGAGAVALVSDPHAAALHHGAQDEFVPGSVVAVYDLGGGTFDAAVLCATESGWEPLGRPQGLERLGGADVDDILFNHVADSLGGALEVLDPDDPTHLAAVARLRHACVEAKEALSARTEVPLAVAIPTMLTTVRLTRPDLDKMVRPSLARSVTALDKTLRSAGVGTSDLTGVLLMGGASRMPLVAEMVGKQVERPVTVAPEPKLGVALGAAIAAAGQDVPDAATTSRVGATAADGPAGREAALAAVGSPASTTQLHAGAGSGGDGSWRAAKARLRGPGPAAQADTATDNGSPDGTAVLTDTAAGERTRRLTPADPSTATATRPLAPIGPLPSRSGSSEPGGQGGRGGRRTLWLVTGGIVAAAVVTAVLVAALAGGDGADEDRVRNGGRNDRPTTTVDEPGGADQDGGPEAGPTTPSSAPGGPEATWPAGGPLTSGPTTAPTTAPPAGPPPAPTTTVAPAPLPAPPATTVPPPPPQ